MSDSVKCLLVGESNIPRRKKILYEKKPKAQRKFPELQKYIEVILAGKNKSEPSTEDGDRAEMKMSKSKTSSICGKSDNKNKLETFRNSIPNRGQSKSTEKTPGEGTSKKRGPESPDSDPEAVYSMVGRFLENLYPNPYDVENKNKPKIQRSKPKNVAGNLKKVPTMVDLLLVSKGRSEKKATTVKTKKLIIPETENKTKIRGTSLDSKSQSCFFQEKIEDVRNENQSNSIYSRQTNSRGSWEGLSSSRNNSRGSYNEKSSREGESSRVYLKRKTNDRILIKNSEQTEDSRAISDFDFGKLKLLTSKYFSDAIRKNSEMQKGKKLGSEKGKRDTVYLENFSSSKNLKKTRESTNLCVPQESKKGQEKSIKDEYSYEHRSLVQYLNEVNISKTSADREEDERTLEYVLRESENHVVIEEIDRESFRFSRNVKRVSLKEDEEKSEIEIFEEETPDQFWEEFERNSADHQKFYETSKKIDDVLQFMYNCLLKFNNEYSSHKNRKEGTQSLPSKSLEENAKPELQAGTSYSSGTYSLQSAKSEENVCHIQSLPLVKDRPGSRELLPEFGESSKQFRQCRKRQSASEHACRSYHGKNTYHNPSQRGSMWPDPEPPNSLLCESADINPQTSIQTVEIQNELGGYSEETLPVSNDDSKISKPILPHSVKFRSRKNDACEVIKNALETEEKLLAEGTASKERIDDEPPEHEVQKQDAPLNSLTLDKILLRYTPDQVGAYSLFSGINQQCPYFVIYVNSLPNNLILMFSSPLSISLNEVKTLDLKNCEMSKAYSNTLYVSRESFHKTSTHAYRFSKDFLRLINKSIVAEIARVASLIFIAEMTKLEPPENSNCLVDVFFASKKLMFEEPASCLVFGVSYVFEQKKTNSRSEVLKVTLISKEKIVTVTGRSLKQEKKTEEKCDEKPMRELESAVEETEEKVFLLPEPGKMLRKLACLERLVNSNSGSAEKEREKVHNLLLRTYSLQNKLYRYLHNMGCLQPSSTSCPLLRRETFLDFGVLFKQKTSAEVFPLGTVNRQQTDSMVCWPSQTSTTNETKTETEDKVRTSQSEETRHKKETFNDEDDGPDYRSSDCSFKSSSDLSGANGLTNEDESSRDSKLLGKIFNELEISRRSHREDDNSKTELNYENKICELEEKSEPSEQEAKAPTKVLKTLFRGKESLTELSMGLKDFPLIEVSNISVEKKKFSANHTKISIRIAKGKSEELNKDGQADESGFRMNGGVRSNISIYDFDRLRPELSTCRTEYCRLEGESEDEDEDDFKSVASSLTESDVASDEEEKQDKEIELGGGKTFSRTTFTKHKFDYYQGTVEAASSTKKTPDYKALEPLQQALTEMQIRMRTVNRNSFFCNNEYYKRALKLAKMSAGYCQNCGNHSVIPDDTFGFYKNLLPTDYSGYGRDCIFRRTPSSSFYSFGSHSRDLNDRMLDINVDQSSYNLLNGRSVRLGPF